MTLPVTSFPLLAKAFGGTMVAPLAFLPMLALLLTVVIPEFLKNRTLPRQFQPIYFFFLFALFSTFLAYMRELPSFRDVPVLRNAAEGFITLLFGFGFYLSTIYLLKDEQQFCEAMQWMNAGGAVIIVIVLAQFIAFKAFGSFPKFLIWIQKAFSASGMLYERRGNGLAYEPSWLAHQLNILYIPLWLGFTVRKETVYPMHLFGKVSFENLLLAGGILSMFLSFSRIGWLAIIAIFMVLFVRASNRIANSVLEKREANSVKGMNKNQRIVAKISLWVSVLLVMIVFISIAGVIMWRLEPRMANLFNFTLLRQYGIMGWASRLSIAERFTYWQAAFNVYLKFPWFGSGLGVSGYYFPETIPSFGYQLPETLRALLYESFIPNAKNLWVRLLAETGIVGFSIFTAWLVLHWRTARELERINEPGPLSTISLAGQLLIIALLFEGFSLDTFGLPYYWVGLGLIVAAWRVRFAAPISGSPQKSD